MRFFFESAGETDDVLRGRSEGGGGSSEDLPGCVTSGNYAC